LVGFKIMVCSSEQSRTNGKFSRGPASSRGRKIASQNATKHGILSQQPPILATEDLESFQGIVQGLIDEYQPQTSTEHLLIQQIAMGWMRLHRLWSTEAAKANIEILRFQRNAKYPSFLAKGFLTSLPGYESQTFEDVLAKEKHVLLCLIVDLEDDLQHIPVDAKGSAKWTEALQRSLHTAWERCPEHTDRNGQHIECWQIRIQLREALETEDLYRRPQKPISPDEAKPKIETLIQAAYRRITEIQTAEAKIHEHDRAIAQAEAASRSLSNTDSFARYERHITKQLNDALDRLAQFQKQPKHEGSMGSFGKDT
jgi:hypothetical protein